MGGGAAAAGVVGAVLAELDILEDAGAGDRVHVAAEIDHRALAGEDGAAGGGRDDGAGHAGGAADRDRGGLRVDRRDDVDRGVERRGVGLRVVGRIDRVDLDQADAREAGDDAGRHPFALRVDDRRAGRDGDVGAGGDDAAVAKHDGAAVDRRRAVADHDAAAGDGDGLRRRAGAAASAATPARRSGEPVQCTSPSPGWPSSKSRDRPQARGLFMSYIRAPSIQTCCGLV